MLIHIRYWALSALLLTGLSHGTEPDLDRLRERIQAQYEAVDAAMATQIYSTRANIRRAGGDNSVEETTFHPDRPEGERERLERVNGEPPSRRDHSRFDRRPQPDSREDQRFRLIIDYDTLRIDQWSDDSITLTFQPILLMNGEADDDSHKFTGVLAIDRDTETVSTVSMTLNEPFSKMFFNIARFTVMEDFAPFGDGLKRTHYYHDIDISNRLLDVSNEATISFDFDTHVTP